MGSSQSVITALESVLKQRDINILILGITSYNVRCGKSDVDKWQYLIGSWAKFSSISNFRKSEGYITLDPIDKEHK